MAAVTVGGAGAISAAGDSGSIWVSAEMAYYPRHAVGLLHKGHGSGYSIANNINTIMAKLSVFLRIEPGYSGLIQ